MQTTRPYYLGCPMWSNKRWAGRFFTRGAKPADFLKQYSSLLSSVEGNTTFYAVPSADTVTKWGSAVAPGFRFCFKFPRLISHDKALRAAERETERFFQVLDPIYEQLGPFFLQLPPQYDDYAALARFLEWLPDRYHYAVEVRNPRFFRKDSLERKWTGLLQNLGMDRVVFDTHRLMMLDTHDPSLLEAQKRKPKTPLRSEPLGQHPFLRYVGYPDLAQDGTTIKQWAVRVAVWIEQGRVPFVFMHQAPDDVRAPELCRLFHAELGKCLPKLPALPPFPVDGEEPEPQQLSLF